MNHPLHLPAPDFRLLLQRQGPSLALWRAAEIAALRQQTYQRPILDLGCGDGLVTAMVLPYVEMGLDPDCAALERAARYGVYQRLRAATIEDAELPQESICTIVSNSVLEHVSDLDSVLMTVSHVLQPGGHLIFTTPTEAFSDWLLLPSGRYAAWRNHQLRHLNLWSVEQWRQHLERAGLELEMVRPYLRRNLVRLWDGLELCQQIWIGRRRAFGIIWRHLSAGIMAHLAQWAATLDLSAHQPGGGRLILARKGVN